MKLDGCLPQIRQRAVKCPPADCKEKAVGPNFRTDNIKRSSQADSPVRSGPSNHEPDVTICLARLAGVRTEAPTGICFGSPSQSQLSPGAEERGRSGSEASSTGPGVGRFDSNFGCAGGRVPVVLSSMRLCSFRRGSDANATATQIYSER
ncbi:hypothetical protein Mp_1g00590 [Marchantia polymorpha subsp. ruderalis]|uniref:Uncharacterized protein n=2 Tax=Marchantia polymorpha TaxID=3197 RepID=A0AAF6AK01_MARPO|nr:hypothetical protein MARPO_0103s0028 [Marchantia polymorpha]BBM96771.1 hypothetical protein Mp_1g00590 [Marchantia polymorpha subsp. ruderalis]|eukprot:PTQ32057.1 hypothetical protein MARPO_0103s0028 [Marchantia polymorpha]